MKALLVAILLIATPVFATELVEKVSEFEARITISNVSDKDGVKTTLSQERTFTLDELLTAKTAFETALKSWQDEAKKCEDNIAQQTTQIALWEKLIKNMTDLGIVAKPIAIWEENKNVDKVIEPIVKQATKGE